MLRKRENSRKRSRNYRKNRKAEIRDARADETGLKKELMLARAAAARAEARVESLETLLELQR